MSEKLLNEVLMMKYAFYVLSCLLSEGQKSLRANWCWSFSTFLSKGQKYWQQKTCAAH